MTPERVGEQEVTSTQLTQRRRLVALGMELQALRAENAALRAELADLRPLVPRRPPKGWLNTKRAAALAGCSEPTIYKRVRSGKVLSVKIAGQIWIIGDGDRGNA